MTKTELTTRQHAPIFKLSRELRTTIYRSLFWEFSQQDLRLCVCCNTTATFSSPPIEILSTCRQVRGEALPILVESLGTRLIFGPCEEHFIEKFPAPRTWILEEHGGLFTDIICDVTWAGRLSPLLTIFPNLAKVTLTGYRGFLPQLEAAEKNYYLDNEYDETVWQMWNEENRYKYEDRNSKVWSEFLESRRCRQRPFKLEAMVNFLSDWIGVMVHFLSIPSYRVTDEPCRRCATTLIPGQLSRRRWRTGGQTGSLFTIMGSHGDVSDL